MPAIVTTAVAAVVIIWMATAAFIAWFCHRASTRLNGHAQLPASPERVMVPATRNTED